MHRIRSIRAAGAVAIVLAFALVGCARLGNSAPTPTPTPSPRPTSTVETAATGEAVHIERDPDVPALPFPDNPDPDACGIPREWGQDDPAWLSGHYDGELVQPTVFLYDSHLRKSVVGKAPTGTKVEVVLFQSNPVLNYYMVRTIDEENPEEGWVPAPFLSFEPVESVQ